MPFSSNSGKEFTSYILKKIKKQQTGLNILDIGPGSGTYSILFRELLSGYWTALEIWEPYIEKYDLRSKYNTVIIGDARTYNFGVDYDIIFLGDIVEHMSKEDGILLVKKCLQRSKYVIVSIPIIHYPQGEYDGNPYEAHVKDDWSDNEVKECFSDYIINSNVENEIGVYVMTDRLNCKETLVPKIAVYGIFKNEEQFILRYLESCKNADQIVLCDTGSTDNTINLIKEFSENNNLQSKIRIEKITVLPWRFDDARNTALSFVSPDIDICISMDIDEYLMDGWKENLIQNYNSDYNRYYHRFCTYWSLQDLSNKSEHWHDRIHNRHGYKWSLPVHEILENYKEEEKIIWLHNFYMYQKPDLTKNRGSYLKLLEMSVKERPDVWKSWSFLASEYYTNNRPNDAIACLNKALTIENCDKSFLYNFKSTVFNYMGNSFDAINMLRLAINENPTIREYQVYLAELYEKLYIKSLENKTPDYSYLKNAKMQILISESCNIKTNGYVYNTSCWDNNFNNIKDRILNRTEE